MLKAVVFGAGYRGKRYYDQVSKKYEVIAYSDNDSRKWGGTIQDKTIIAPDEICKSGYDVVVITSTTGRDSIAAQLIDTGVRERDIDTSFVDGSLESRKTFLRNLAGLFQIYKESGMVAEAGVFEGDFAKLINEVFPEKELHLFDTFQGFDDRDIKMESGLSPAKIGDYSNTSVQTVMNKMMFPHKVHVHQGYFPETARKIDAFFCFVNLDMDLYEPTYQGLLFFSERMTKNGVILVHDYFDEYYKGPKQAVDKFINEKNGKYRALPIGDGISIMIVQGIGTKEHYEE